MKKPVQMFSFIINKIDYIEFQSNCRMNDLTASQVLRKMIKDYNKANRTLLQKLLEENDQNAANQQKTPEINEIN